MVLTSFLVGLTLVVAALFVLVLRAIALWKDGKRVGGVLSSELDSIEERSTRTEQLLAEAERASADLQAATERLRISRARLQVLVGSLQTAGLRTRWLRAFLPLR